MTRFLTGFFLVLFLAVSAPSVFAQDTRQDLAMEVVETYNAPALILEQIELSSPQIVDAFRANIPDLTEPEGDMIISYFMEEMRALMPEFTREFAAIYAGVFTEAELRELLSDPNSTLDGRLMEAQPQITSEANALGERYGQQAMLNAMPRITEMIENR